MARLGAIVADIDLSGFRSPRVDWVNQLQVGIYGLTF